MNAQWDVVFDVIESIHARPERAEEHIHIYRMEWEQFVGGYWRRVEEVLSTYGSPWTVGDTGSGLSGIVRRFDENVAVVIDDVDAKTHGRFDAANELFNEGVRVIGKRDGDMRVGVRSVVDAAESVGRTIFPKCRTFGDVVDTLKKSGVHQALSETMAKLWGYASAVHRHGDSLLPTVSRQEAEYVLVMSAAVIRFLIDSFARPKGGSDEV